MKAVFIIQVSLIAGVACWKDSNYAYRLLVWCVVAVKNIVGHLASIIMILGLMFLPPALVGLIYSEHSFSHFLGLAAALTTLGFFLRRKLPLQEVSTPEAMAIAALVWLVVAGVGAIPYITIGGLSPLDAYFEAMSGFTTTGMTLIRDVEGLPRSLLFWRSFTQWIGGVGVLVLFILFLTPEGLGVGVWRLYAAESREERLAASTRATVTRIWQIYLFYTVACASSLMLVGIEPFDAINHSLTALATGGFSTHNLSIGALNNPAAEAVLVLFMIIGAISFLVHLRVFRVGPKALIDNKEVLVFLSILAASFSLISLDLIAHGFTDFFGALRVAIFQAVSIITSTGYTTANIEIFPPFSQVLLLFLMLIGGCVGSTSGAIKVMRLIILAKLGHHLLLKLKLPLGVVTPIRIGSSLLHEEDALRVAGFFAIYTLLLTVGCLCMTACDLDPFSSFSAVLSAQSNIGPNFLPLNALPPIPKAILIFEMWAGRLEIIPVLILFMPRSWLRVS
ncbi:MAG: TrkH family potassium uptake protein [Candidatus Bathyarchaeia archaeon]